MSHRELIEELVGALEFACAEMCEGCRYDAQLVAGDSGHHKPRIGGYTPCQARKQREALTKAKLIEDCISEEDAAEAAASQERW